MAQKSLMIIWNDPKIISVNDKAELCHYSGILENKRNSDVGDDLKPEEWGDPKLTHTFLGAWMLQDPSFGRGQYEEHPLGKALRLESSSIRHMNQ